MMQLGSKLRPILEKFLLEKSLYSGGSRGSSLLFWHGEYPYLVKVFPRIVKVLFSFVGLVEIRITSREHAIPFKSPEGSIFLNLGFGKKGVIDVVSEVLGDLQ